MGGRGGRLPGGRGKGRVGLLCERARAGDVERAGDGWRSRVRETAASGAGDGGLARGRRRTRAREMWWRVGESRSRRGRCGSALASGWMAPVYGIHGNHTVLPQRDSSGFLRPRIERRLGVLSRNEVLGFLPLSSIHILPHQQNTGIETI